MALSFSPPSGFAASRKPPILQNLLNRSSSPTPSSNLNSSLSAVSSSTVSDNALNDIQKSGIIACLRAQRCLFLSDFLKYWMTSLLMIILFAMVLFRAHQKRVAVRIKFFSFMKLNLLGFSRFASWMLAKVGLWTERKEGFGV